MLKHPLLMLCTSTGLAAVRDAEENAVLNVTGAGQEPTLVLGPGH